jgi:hypothetical protein
MMVINGYETISSGNFVLVADPLPMLTGDSRQVRYENYIAEDGHYSHWFDYYDISLAPAISNRDAPGGGPAGDDPSAGPSGDDPTTVNIGGPKNDNVAPQQIRKASEVVTGIKDSAIAAEKSSKSSATQALGTYKELNDANPANAPGGPEKGGTPKIGQAIPVVRLRVDQLLSAPAGNVTGVIDTNVSKVVYPIFVNNKVDSSVTMTKTDDNHWLDTEYGNKLETAQLVNFRRKYSRSLGALTSDFFAVSIPGLHKIYLATKAASGLTLIPISDDADLEQKAGVPQNAEIVFEKLARKAANDTKDSN